MTFGLTAQGFNIKRFVDSKTELISAWKSLFGNIDTSDNSVIGQIINQDANADADLWQQLQNIYNAQYPKSASGVSLDYAVSFNGITRNPATYSTGKIGITGDKGTVVSSGFQIAASIYSEIFSTVESITITNENIQKIYFKVETATPLTIYTITINGIDITVESSSANPASSSAIAALFKIELDAHYADDLKLTITDCGNGILLIESENTFTVDVDTNCKWCAVAFINALNKGAIIAPSGALTFIINPQSGVAEVNNFEDIIKGNAVESDAALRLRREQSIKIAGSGVLEAIRAKLLQLPNVNATLILENAQNNNNDTDPTHSLGDDINIPLHSMEVIIDGGDDTAIANLLWQHKGAGTQLYSSQSENPGITIRDSMNFAHVIKFTRPYQRKAWVKVSLTLNPEETFPTGGETIIQGNIVSYGNTLTIGNDVVLQKFIVPIYSVTGILNALLYICVPQIEAFTTVETLADNDALFTYLQRLRGNPLLNNDIFFLANINDTTNQVLKYTKDAVVPSSNLARYDIFKIVNAASKTLVYLGNLRTDNTMYTTTGYIPIDSVQNVIFKADTTMVAVI